MKEPENKKRPGAPDPGIRLLCCNAHAACAQCPKGLRRWPARMPSTPHPIEKDDYKGASRHQEGTVTEAPQLLKRGPS